MDATNVKRRRRPSSPPPTAPPAPAVRSTSVAHQQPPTSDDDAALRVALASVVRPVLDFDREKVCSVTLSNLNVYACLTCGVLVQGRGPDSVAYAHALETGHPLYMHTTTTAAWMLPDGTPVPPALLADVAAVLRPRYAPADIAGIDAAAAEAPGVDLAGNAYLRGVVGLNNLSATDGINAVLLALAHVRPLRDFALDDDAVAAAARSPLASAFGAFVRKVWHGGNFKAHVSPHELVQVIAKLSRKRFRPGVPSDPLAFLVWFLNELARGIKLPKAQAKALFADARSRLDGELPAPAKLSRSLVDLLFRGKVTTRTEELEGGAAAVRGDWIPISVATVPFLFLALEVPNPPLYPSDKAAELAHQVSLAQLLAKYDGVTPTHIGARRRKYIIPQDGLPRFLVLHLDRSDAAGSGASGASGASVTAPPPPSAASAALPDTSANATVVNFPLDNLDMAPYLAPAAAVANSATTYALLAAITHEREAGQASGTYAVTIAPASKPGEYFRVLDLDVTPLKA
ncbi:U4/U6.U5 tri-snRNP-associated protein [Thecamonas trahens ATCC 50062]|uniref:U4/U6.U5 tri-snRNP-associated protein n=1 Tax=Thecamonas trahens ATCC 50062 TaxID=461836 RepID=A0A0L0DF07_THETB|nr:U4/U6.U5 tri-snRNP-associated protein [Thecamonas trahens ATCC 50062]KNC50810.1 U4/U6.U5 tri-snRNP-associated protein [Thecamonas trahens ATCC 50062]|eukprot:XP_013756766.1 U4/U6.U5 tri-snRNP-associated protein [Thecamonas trahens ATCC 50062]